MTKYEVEFESTGEISEFKTVEEAVRYVYHTAHSFGQMPLIEVRERVASGEDVAIYEPGNGGHAGDLSDGSIRRVK